RNMLMTFGSNEMDIEACIGGICVLAVEPGVDGRSFGRVVAAACACVVGGALAGRRLTVTGRKTVKGMKRGKDCAWGACGCAAGDCGIAKTESARDCDSGAFIGGRR